MYARPNSLVRHDKLHFQGACSGGGALTVRLDNAAFRHLTAGRYQNSETESFARILVRVLFSP